jgi:hypothetical protein
MTILLYELWRADNGLGVEGAKLIANALVSNRTLTTLGVGGTDSIIHWRRRQNTECLMAFLFYELLWTGNELGVEGANVIARALESNQTLTTLELFSTDSVMHW